MPMCQTPRTTDASLRAKTTAANDNFLPIERHTKRRGLENAYTAACSMLLQALSRLLVIGFTRFRRSREDRS